MDTALIIERVNQLKEAKINTENELNRIEKRQAELQSTLSRIAGAIQVLEELINEQNDSKEQS